MTTLMRDSKELLDSSLIDGSDHLWKTKAKVTFTLLKGHKSKWERMLVGLQECLSVLALQQTVSALRIIKLSTTKNTLLQTIKNIVIRYMIVFCSLMDCD
jgi:hypothetical protein